MNDNYKINVLTFLSSRTPPVSSEAIKLFLGDKSGYAGRFRILFGVIDTYNKNTRETKHESELTLSNLCHPYQGLTSNLSLRCCG